MFDTYSQMREHVREVAYLHSKTLTSWKDAVRENCDNDLDCRLEISISELLPLSLKGLLIPLLILTLMIFLFLTSCTAPQTQPTLDSVPTDISQADMPNPASVYCKDQGNRVEIRTAELENIADLIVASFEWNKQ